MRFFTTTTQLIPSRSKNLGIITLNHPKALHALTRDMIDSMEEILTDYLASSSSSSDNGSDGNDTTGRNVHAILLKSSNTDTKRRAFCAGGDVKTLYMLGKGINITNNTDAVENRSSDTDTSNPSNQQSQSQSRPEDFFYHEYRVNHMIATSSIPIISLWDGVVFGGGVGISIHGTYRIATEHTLFAMPETAIGLYPDVGGMYFLPRIMNNNNNNKIITTNTSSSSPNPMANYLALTGRRIGPADLLYTGLATHYVPSNQLSDLEVALADATVGTDSSSRSSHNDTGSSAQGEIDAAIRQVLTSFHQDLPTDDCLLASNHSNIEQAFSAETVEEIVSNLTSMSNTNVAGDDVSSSVTFAKDTLTTLHKMSPTSLKLTLEGLKRGAKCSTIGEDLQMEYRMSRTCVRRPQSDFYEGVRAMLVDKDFTPRWNPSNIEDVTTEMIDDFFAPIGDSEWMIPQMNSKLTITTTTTTTTTTHPRL